MNPNSDIQATHQLIRFLEEAKAQSELVLDDLPGLFMVIDAQGLIYRGNTQLATFMGVPFESLAGHQILETIGPANWPLFSQNLTAAKQAAKSGIDFEIKLRDRSKTELSFLMNIRKFENDDYRTDLDLYVVIGRDVTEIKQVTEKMTRMHSELLTAKAVQDTLFPEPEFNSPQVSLSGYYQPASECGGDWWFYNTIGNRVFLWIGDVTGHGVGSALVTSAARAAVSGIESMPDIGPAKALEILNKAVYSSSKGHKYMSFCVAAINLETGDCTYATAGHECPLLVALTPARLSGDFQISPLPARPSYLLGQEKNAKYVEHTAQLHSGDRLFFYTDGVSEMVNEQGSMWGERAVLKSVMECSKKSASAETFVANFTQKIAAFRGQAELKDDVTFFVFHLQKLDSPPLA